MNVLTPPIRAEYEHTLGPLPDVQVTRVLALRQRLWQRTWLRKSVILAVLAALWEAAARYQDNDLLLPTFLQTLRAFAEGMASGELLVKARISLAVLLQGYLAGILAAFALTTAAVSTQIGRDLLSMLT